jgi:hypothetical protein
MTEYVLVFDARSVPPVQWSDFIMLPIMAAVILAFWTRRKARLPGEPRHPLIDSPVRVAAVAAFALLGTGVMVTVRYDRVVSLRERLRSGDYEQVEGRVEEFVPGDRGGHRYESWAVRSGGRTWRYRYRSPDENPGFHQSAGPIREGLRVRLADVDGYIARLEIERGAEDAYGNR